jgi:hypothetical protein
LPLDKYPLGVYTAVRYPEGVSIHGKEGIFHDGL